MVKIITKEIELAETHEDDVVDITKNVQQELEKTKMKHGNVLVFVPGSTGAVTTIEYEPGCIRDLPRTLQKLAPRGENYEHHKTWNDGNGHSHMRASIMKPDLTVPFSGGKLILGTWQQVVFCEFDNKPRKRKIVLQLIGE